MIAWAASAGLAGVALLAIGSNWAGMLGLLRHLSGGAARSYSPIPLIGGVLGAAALAAAPVEAVNRWFWLPLLRPPPEPACTCWCWCVYAYQLTASYARPFSSANRNFCKWRICTFKTYNVSINTMCYTQTIEENCRQTVTKERMHVRRRRART